MAFTIGLYLALVKEVDERIEFAETLESRHKWRVFSIYIIVTYVMSLRGREGLFLDLKGLNRYWNEREDILKNNALG